jgi:hypothetical protein
LRRLLWRLVRRLIEREIDRINARHEMIRR